MNRMIQRIKDEKGSVESALVLIPLLILFVTGMQIAAAIHLRNVEKIAAQDDASKRAISGEFHSGDEFIHIESSGDGQNLDLLVTRRSIQIPTLFGLTPGPIESKREVDVGGIAIVENGR